MADTNPRRKPLPATTPQIEGLAEAIFTEVLPEPPSRETMAEYDLEIERARTEVLKNLKREQDLTLRWIVGIWVLILVSLWMVLVAVLLISDACDCSKMSESTRLGVLGSTTVSVIGVSVVVVTSLFPKTASQSE